MTGLKNDGLYTTLLPSKNPEVNISVKTILCAKLQDMVYYFYLVFNCHHFEAYCKLVDSMELTGLPTKLISTIFKKYFSHQDLIR